MIILWSLLVLGILGFILGSGLAIASYYLSVKEDTRIVDVSKMLPGYNCGACGSAGCSSFASKIVSHEETKLSLCKPGKADINFNPIIEYLLENPDEDGTIFKVEI